MICRSRRERLVSAFVVKEPPFGFDPFVFDERLMLEN
jgi:hypothetical protein